MTVVALHTDFGAAPKKRTDDLWASVEGHVVERSPSLGGRGVWVSSFVEKLDDASRFALLSRCEQVEVATLHRAQFEHLEHEDRERNSTDGPDRLHRPVF